MFGVTLAPLIGDRSAASQVFGLGAFAMAFSTIIVLMLINGYALAEVTGQYESRVWRVIGAALVGMSGFCWFLLPEGQDSRTWLVMVASAFAGILLPIAYFAFLLMMNSRPLLGDERPRGAKRLVWNILMIAAVVGALANSTGAMLSHRDKPVTSGVVWGGVAMFVVLMLFGFSARRRPDEVPPAPARRPGPGGAGTAARRGG
jgi:hypothetical protein